MKIHIIILFVLLALTSCEKDDFERLSDFSKAEIFIAAPGTNSSQDNVIPLAINDFIGIADVSQGVDSRLWTISEGNSFLTPRFKPEDSLNLAPFIDRSLGLKSDTSTIHVLFRRPGRQTINYRGVFPRQVFVGAEFTRDSVPSVQEGNQWVLELEYKFDIIDNLNARAKVLRDGSQVGELNLSQNFDVSDKSSFAIETIEVGESLTFESALGENIGQPNSIGWFTRGSFPEEKEGESITATYNAVGDFTVDIILNRSNRGQTLRETSHTETIPILVRVTPSTKPLNPNESSIQVLPNPNMDGSNRIAFEVNGAVAEITNTAQNNFTLNVTNGSFNQAIPVGNVEVDSDNPSRVILTLNEPIFNSDTVTLSYNGPGILADSRQLENFANLEVTPNFENILTQLNNASFEFASSSSNVGAGGFRVNAQSLPAFSLNPDGSPILQRTTDISVTEGLDGVAAMRFFRDNENLEGTFFSFLFDSFANPTSGVNLPPGDYRLDFDVLIAQGGFTGPFVQWQGVTPQPFDRVLDFTDAVNNIGQWTTISESFTTNTTITNSRLILNIRNTEFPGGNIVGPQEFFLDNFKLFSVERRP